MTVFNWIQESLGRASQITIFRWIQECLGRELQMTVFSWIIVFSFFYAIFNVAGAAIIKNKLLIEKISGLKDFMIFLIDPKIFIAMTFIFISMFFSIKALSLSAFSSVIPLMTAINFITTITVGVSFFGDHLALSSYIGISLILLGIFMLSIKSIG